MESFLELNSSIQADFLMGSVDLNYRRFSCYKAQYFLYMIMKLIWGISILSCPKGHRQKSVPKDSKNLDRSKVGFLVLIIVVILILGSAS